eukprot:TRINITY_DN13560_c0_g1_i2.p1 TRINITY_DN13560_c0_g1~~TRINITY_DN13560_c0_g1_i2.p1  ORF type:complete len:233 (+),score=64.96 TRINITY_DN13560_c0_g1_i2:90-701(+)
MGKKEMNYIVFVGLFVVVACQSQDTFYERYNATYQSLADALEHYQAKQPVELAMDILNVVGNAALTARNLFDVVPPFVRHLDELGYETLPFVNSIKNVSVYTHKLIQDIARGRAKNVLGDAIDLLSSIREVNSTYFRLVDAFRGNLERIHTDPKCKAAHKEFENYIFNTDMITTVQTLRSEPEINRLMLRGKTQKKGNLNEGY